MSSIWSGAAAHTGLSPLASGPTAPTPGGGAAAKFQSILQAAGKQGQGVGQAGLSPKASSAAGAPMTAPSGSSSASDSDAGISANDFLTLLVTEMQNQDPTADVDPNEYIDQLVQINSLEQLISINQNLATVLDAASSTPPSSGGAAPGVAAAGAPQAGVRSSSAVQTPGGRTSSSAASAVQSSGASSRPSTVRGNLSAPGAAPAARTVGRALDGHPRAAPHGHAIRDIPTRALP